MSIPENLYRQILPVIPIPCVDLLIVDREKRVLLVKRRNEPAKGLWWLPGGRVHIGEMRATAAVRKLHEECGLKVFENPPIELSTEDLMLPNGHGAISHVIVTVYQIEVNSNAPIVLDRQSDAAEWRSSEAWLRTDLHPYVRKLIGRDPKFLISGFSQMLVHLPLQNH